MKRPDASQCGELPPPSCLPGEVTAAWPLLVEFLTCERWDDGKRRERGSLVLVIEDGQWKVCLNDRALKRSLWRTAPTAQDALQSIENALFRNEDGWRRWKS